MIVGQVVWSALFLSFTFSRFQIFAKAASWDANLAEEWGQALGAEHRSKGANMILGPSVNVHRVARGGRNAEYISGESP